MYVKIVYIANEEINFSNGKLSRGSIIFFFIRVSAVCQRTALVRGKTICDRRRPKVGTVAFVYNR